MEENRQPMEEEQPQVYKPRPTWQVWMARIGLVIMILAVIAYYLNIFSGGRL